MIGLGLRRDGVMVEGVVLDTCYCDSSFSGLNPRLRSQRTRCFDYKRHSKPAGQSFCMMR